MRTAIAADLGVLFFGLLLPWPYALSTDGRADSALALALALLALLVRVVFGRRPALALYAVALAATVVSAIHATLPGVTTASDSHLGIAFAAWELLIVAALAQLAALYEGRAEASIVAGLLALGAVYFTRDALAAVALVFALVATGAAFAFVKGRAWSLAWYGAGALASLLAVPGLRERIPNGAYWQVGVLLALALLAYLLSAQLRAPQGTALATFYGIWAAVAFPEPHALPATLAFTLLVALLAVALRLRVGRDWALALDALAIAASLATLSRVTPYDAADRRDVAAHLRRRRLRARRRRASPARGSRPLRLRDLGRDPPAQRAHAAALRARHGRGRGGARARDRGTLVAAVVSRRRGCRARHRTACHSRRGLRGARPARPRARRV